MTERAEIYFQLNYSKNNVLKAIFAYNKMMMTIKPNAALNAEQVISSYSTIGCCC